MKNIGKSLYIQFYKEIIFFSLLYKDIFIVYKIFFIDVIIILDFLFIDGHAIVFEHASCFPVRFECTGFFGQEIQQTNALFNFFWKFLFAELLQKPKAICFPKDFSGFRWCLFQKEYTKLRLPFIIGCGSEP